MSVARARSLLRNAFMNPRRFNGSATAPLNTETDPIFYRDPGPCRQVRLWGPGQVSYLSSGIVLGIEGVCSDALDGIRLALAHPVDLAENSGERFEGKVCRLRGPCFPVKAQQ